jgi:hypothetical protein
VGGIILPGIFKSIEVKTPALVEEQSVEGSSAKPKQAVGYEDAKILFELILDDSPEQTKLDKLTLIQNLFKKPAQAKPVVYEIVNEHTAIRGVSKVIFKDLTTKEQNKKSEVLVSIEFWEYIPITIKATKKSTKSKSSSSAASLSYEYLNYLTGKGAAPSSNTQTNSIAFGLQIGLQGLKTAKTPATDNASYMVYKNMLAAMPFG